MIDESLIDLSKLKKCYAVCNKVGYRGKYLNNNGFCDHFISPMAGSSGQFQRMIVIIRTIIGEILDNGIQNEFGEKIAKMVKLSDYKELSQIRPEDILALGTIFYFLGNKFKLAFYVEPFGGRSSN